MTKSQVELEFDLNADMLAALSYNSKLHSIKLSQYSVTSRLIKSILVNPRLQLILIQCRGFIYVTSNDTKDFISVMRKHPNLKYIISNAEFQSFDQRCDRSGIHYVTDFLVARKCSELTWQPTYHIIYDMSWQATVWALMTLYTLAPNEFVLPYELIMLSLEIASQDCFIQYEYKDAYCYSFLHVN